ncbi:Solute carrier family 12 member 1 [Strongyloides ratti]|uniref:Solute carrier family 12 member 3 n=1 Tax=Strongyloides ratti TaxID=34506 RepID=A0A090LML5_STRRB|nr:Solute carrier family 12 member 1 [Strongyloides ratti]CEF69408.1 Solute carrier family 12 member 1 [Strongyloides ratti]
MENIQKQNRDHVDLMDVDIQLKSYRYDCSEKSRTNSGFIGDDISLPTSIMEFNKEGRPTLHDLIKKNIDEDITGNILSGNITTPKRIDSESIHEDEKFQGFGWVKGVLLRCILCIIGATLYMRMSWIAGQAGIFLGMMVILLSLIVVTITAVSMSAIATNGEIKNGGCYYLISRSLGPEFGGSIGLILYIANMVNGAMNCVGLAESLVFLFGQLNFKLFDGGINDVRVYGLSTCVILQGIIFIGTEFENKTQIILLITIILSILSHTIGAFLPVTQEQLKHGIIGFSFKTIMNNFWPDFRDGNSFITVFGVYFPAMTGIMAGANMSGDLKDPSKSIPIGTMTAIMITTIIYSGTMLLSACATVRDSTGFNIPTFPNNNYDLILPTCRQNNTCKFGLANDYQVPLTQAAFSPLIIAGIIASTLSSASGCLIGAPRIFQALCQDKLFPGLSYFGKGRGITNEPFNAYFLTFFLTCCVILIGDLNAISEIITNFFLAAFAITNFACFDSSASKSPGFRPGFKYYNKWLSLFGSVLCISLMFILSWVTSLITLFIFAILFLFLKHTVHNVNWGSSTEANRYRIALMELLKLSRHEEHVKNYRPQILVLTGNPIARQSLVDFTHAIMGGQNLMLCGHVVPYVSSVSATACIRKLNSKMSDIIKERKWKSFYCSISNKSLRNGVQGLLQSVGLGKMQPNILLIGFKYNWLKETLDEKYKNDVKEYQYVILDAFESNMNLCIFKNGNERLDHSILLRDFYEKFLNEIPEILMTDKTNSLQEDYLRGYSSDFSRQYLTISSSQQLIKHRSLSSIISLGNGSRNSSSNDITADIKISINDKFRYKINNGIIDVWWLDNDGGLILLIPYLLTTNIHSYLHNASLRIFVIVDSHNINPEKAKENLQKLLHKFRIKYTEIIVIVEENNKLCPETEMEYNFYIELLNPKLNSQNHLLNSTLLEKYSHKTRQYLWLREVILKNSIDSNLLIISLPIAHESVILSPLYMIWLDLLSKDMPPILFVKGNNISVLTYIS